MLIPVCPPRALSQFTFVRMGGTEERVEVHLISDSDTDQADYWLTRRLLRQQFATFDAAKAQCFLASDREHLLAVIEAGFGDCTGFNRVARSVFAAAVGQRAQLAVASPALVAVGESDGDDDEGEGNSNDLEGEGEEGEGNEGEGKDRDLAQ